MYCHPGATVPRSPLQTLREESVKHYNCKLEVIAMFQSTRRNFLGILAAGAAGYAARTHGADEQRKLKLGVIGVGWYGMVDVKAALKAGGVEIPWHIPRMPADPSR